jgi:molecular chaperone GrpE
MEKEESLQQKKETEDLDKKSENGKPETALEPEISNASNDSKEKELTPEDKIKDLEDKLVRSYAEIENQRRRFEKEKEDAFDYGGFSFAKEALNLVDNLERSKVSLENDESLKNTEALKKTIEHLEIINNDMISILKKNNIEEIKSINQKLDPNFHQAIMEIEDDKKESGTIVQEIQKGFMIKDRLLRPSLVAVSKKPSNKNEDLEKERKDQQNQQKNEKD